MNIRILCTLLILPALAAACGDDTTTPSRYELTLPGAGDHGIFDPSLAADPDTGRIWMACSAVDHLLCSNSKAISTRLAWSEDAGKTWVDCGVFLNQAEDITLPGPVYATWEYEVASLCRDPGAPANARWKLFFHRYLAVGEARLFQYGWIGMKSAATPEGLTNSSESKLITGSIYSNEADVWLGPPLLELHNLHADLAGCVAFSEPGAFATASALYLCLLGAEGASTNGRIVLIRSNHGGAWEYLGSFLVNTNDGPALGCHGFSAPALYEKNGTRYLLVTPQTNDRYLGTRIFRIADLDTATLVRDGTVPRTITTIPGTTGSHRGAAAWIPEATGCGVLYSEVLVQEPLFFRIYASGVNPPQ